jgi:hypothetical protein
MSILSLDFTPKNDEKIIIKDDSDDSFYSQNSIKLKGVTNKKKSLFDKISSSVPNTKKIKKNNNNTKIYKNNKNYKNINCKIKNETKNILEKSFIDFQKSKEEYYNDVLEFLNLIFCNNSISILNIKTLKISLNEDVFLKYNDIVKKYKLKKDLFDLENFNINDNYDYESIAEIAKILVKNLLEKLNYKLEIINYDNKKKFKIKNISQQI